MVLTQAKDLNLWLGSLEPCLEIAVSCLWAIACDKKMDNRTTCSLVNYQGALNTCRGFEAFNFRPLR